MDQTIQRVKARISTRFKWSPIVEAIKSTDPNAADDWVSISFSILPGKDRIAKQSATYNACTRHGLKITTSVQDQALFARRIA